MYYYSLRIDINIEDFKIELIDRILGVKSNYNFGGWGLEVIQKEEDHAFPFIEYFLSLLENKYSDLEKISIFKDDITIWLLYEYDGQCNLEFSPSDLLRIGKENITFCISCWEKE